MGDSAFVPCLCGRRTPLPMARRFLLAFPGWVRPRRRRRWLGGPFGSRFRLFLRRAFRRPSRRGGGRVTAEVGASGRAPSTRGAPRPAETGPEKDRRAVAKTRFLGAVGREGEGRLGRAVLEPQPPTLRLGRPTAPQAPLGDRRSGESWEPETEASQEAVEDTGRAEGYERRHKHRGPRERRRGGGTQRLRQRKEIHF